MPAFAMAIPRSSNVSDDNGQPCNITTGRPVPQSFTYNSVPSWVVTKRMAELLPTPALRPVDPATRCEGTLKCNLTTRIQWRSRRTSRPPGDVHRPFDGLLECFASERMFCIAVVVEFPHRDSYTSEPSANGPLAGRL